MATHEITIIMPSGKTKQLWNTKYNALEYSPQVVILQL